MKIFKNTSILIALLLICNVTKSQTDIGMWNTISLEKEITKKFSVTLDEELRLKDTLSRLNLLYTNLGISYKPFKGFKLSLTYRFIQKYTDLDEFNYRNRLMFDASYKYFYRNFELKYRARIQAETINDNKNRGPEWYWRNKFELKYYVWKFAPYIGTELRYQIRVQNHPETDLGWHRVRLFAGVQYAINKNNTVEIYYLRQHEFYILDPNEIHVLGLQYSLTLPYKKPEKKPDEKVIN